MTQAIRWILVLPAAFVAPVVMWLALMVSNEIRKVLGQETGHPFWIQVVGSAFLGYYFVVGGARTAPKYRSSVAIALGMLLVLPLLALLALGARWSEALGLEHLHQFGHSLVVVGGVAFGVIRTYSEWDDETLPSSFRLKSLVLTGTVAFLIFGTTSMALVVWLDKLQELREQEAVEDRLPESPAELSRFLHRVVETSTLDARPVKANPCGPVRASEPGKTSLCIDRFRAEVTSDGLGLKSFRRILRPDEPEQLASIAYLLNDGSEDKKEVCTDEMWISLMRDLGLRLEYYYFDVSDRLLFAYTIDAKACDDYFELEELMRTGGEDSEDNVVASPVDD
jgi:hypothetical protein